MKNKIELFLKICSKFCFTYLLSNTQRKNEENFLNKNDTHAMILCDENGKVA